MKIKFLYVFFVILSSFLPIYSGIASSSIVTDTPIWRSTVNVPAQQLTINGQDNDFIISLFVSAKRQTVLQVTYLQNSNMIKDTFFLTFAIGKQTFRLTKEANNNHKNQTNFNKILTIQQLQSFLHDFTAKETAYIIFNRDTIPISLEGTSSIVSGLLRYLDAHPITELPSPFGKLTPSNSTSLFNFSLPHIQLLYGMASICFLLLFGRPTFRILNNIFKKNTARRRVKKAIRIANYEIERQAKILYIKRDQLLYKDDYGTLIQDKWLQEAQRFLRTKIKPLLYNYQLLDVYPCLQKSLLKKILYIAKYPPKNKKRKYKNLKQPQYHYSPMMNPIDYEAYCAELLRQIGWDAKVTTASGDQGADVIAVKKGITLIIQCKLYSKPVGNKAVQEVNAAKVFYHAQYAAVVSNADYTISARQLAASTKVSLLHHETMQNFAHKLK